MKMETGRLFATMKMQQVGLVSAFRCFLFTLGRRSDRLSIIMTFVVSVLVHSSIDVVVLPRRCRTWWRRLGRTGYSATCEHRPLYLHVHAVIHAQADHLPVGYLRTTSYDPRSYGGVVVAKLPFEPWPFFQKITHRGLAGSNATDAALVQCPSTPCERHRLQFRSCSMRLFVLTAALQHVQLDY